MYRYQLEKYRGRSTRHVCPQCGRKGVFTRYVDTENNNIYISDNVGKCNRLDKCGYHYTPHQYFTDNPWKRDRPPREDGSLRPCGYHYTPHQYCADTPWKRDAQPRGDEVSFFRFNREKEKKKDAPEPKRVSAGLPRRVLDATMTQNSAYLAWLESRFGSERCADFADNANNNY